MESIVSFSLAQTPSFLFYCWGACELDSQKGSHIRLESKVSPRRIHSHTPGQQSQPPPNSLTYAWTTKSALAHFTHLRLDSKVSSRPLNSRVAVAQSVERRSDTPLTQVQLPGAARDFLPESTFSAHSLTVSAQPSCAAACTNISAHVKDPKHWQPYHCLETGKYCTNC